MKLFNSLLFLVISIVSLHSQSFSIQNYENAVRFTRQNYLNKTAFNLNTKVEWMPDEKHAIYTLYGKNGKKYKKINLSNFTIDDLFDHSKLSDLLDLSTEEDLMLSDLKLENDQLKFTHNKTDYTLDLIKYTLQKSDRDIKERRNKNEAYSPDGKWIAFAKDYNLFIKSSTDSSQVFQLSHDGRKNYEYASYYGWNDLIKGENGDRPFRFSVSWSPDSKYIKANLVDLRSTNKMYMLDFSQEDLFRPELYSYYRGSPGDTNMVYLTTKFYDVNSQKEIALNLPRKTHINALESQWTNEEGILIANDVERGYKTNTLLKIDLKQSIIKTLFTEQSETNIDDFRYYHFEKQEKLLFLSQRSGWRQMYIYDLKSGQIDQIAPGEYVVNDLAYINEDTGEFWVSISGKDSSMNPYHQMIYKVDLSGKMNLVTSEKMHHWVDFSPSGAYFVDNFSTVEIPTTTVLRSAETGEILITLSEADVSELSKMGWQPPLVFSMLGKDDKTEIFGAIWRPSNFDPSKKYPIIDHTYTGPHTQVFPKSFDRSLNNQALAELGFLVISVDGLGTTGRSKAFKNHSYKNMGANLEDHVRAIKKLSEKYDWIDAERVGIFGHSAGGYDAGHGMLAFPDFYKVGVASSADHDFRMEKAWWPEMYMGWPVDSTYHHVSNVTLAKNLKGNLLLVHGNMDDNVNASATYKLAEELIKADKAFDLLILPSQNHGYQGDYSRYFTKKRWNYFVEHLLNEEPIWDFSWD